MLHSLTVKLGLVCRLEAVIGLAPAPDTRKTKRQKGAMQKTRIHMGRMALVLLVTLLMPLIIGVLLDLLLETSPWITVTMAIVSLPISAFFVVRQGLSEMQQVIDTTAPPVEADSLTSLPEQSQQR